MSATIPRPNQVPACRWFEGCPRSAVGEFVGTPYCVSHTPDLHQDWRPYAPVEPVVEAPSGQPEDKPGKRGCPRNHLCVLFPGHQGTCDEREPAPIAIGVVAEAARMLAMLDAADSHGVRVELLALSLERAYQTGRADALLAREGK